MLLHCMVHMRSTKHIYSCRVCIFFNFFFDFFLWKIFKKNLKALFHVQCIYNGVRVS